MLDSEANEEYAANRERRALPSAYMESPRLIDELTMVINITKDAENVRRVQTRLFVFLEFLY